MTYWLWAGTRNTYAGRETVGKLHLVEVTDRDHGTVVAINGNSWGTLCRSYAPRSRTRGYFAHCLTEAVPCKRCWELYTDHVLADIEEEADR